MSDSEYSQRIGDARNPGGAMFRITDPRGTADVLVYAFTMELERRGVVIDDLISRRLENLRSELRVQAMTAIGNLEPPMALLELLAARSKTDVRRVARTLEICTQDLAALFHNANRYGFQHELVTREFLPDQLRRNQEELRTFFSDPQSVAGRRWFRKMKTAFDQRRHISVHWLSRETQWHCFYFDYRDAFIADSLPHWVGGTHVHFINHLWTMPREVVETTLTSRQSRLPAVHIHYKDTVHYGR